MVVPSVAHVLELPGKLCLSREQYLVVQPIHYPGFTIMGAAEPLSLLVLGALLAFTPAGISRFWLLATATLAVAATHALYWILAAPVNRLRLQAAQIPGSAKRFFDAAGALGKWDWTELRDRRERSWADTSVLSLVTLPFALVG